MFTVCKYTLYTELFCHCLRQSFSSILLKKKSLTLRKKCQKFWCGDTVKDQKQSRNSLLGRMQWKTKCVQKKKWLQQSAHRNCDHWKRVPEAALEAHPQKPCTCILLLILNILVAWHFLLEWHLLSSLCNIKDVKNMSLSYANKWPISELVQAGLRRLSAESCPESQQ